MDFKLYRTFGTDYDTLGYITLDGKEYCKTIEDAVRDAKIKAQTCIPYGEYKIKMTYSPKYKKDMPLLYNDDKTLTIIAENGDKWEGVRVHGGMTNLDTEGCILVAKNQYKNTKLEGKKYIDGTPVMNWIQGSMQEDFRGLFKDNKIYTFTILHGDVLKKETLYKLRNPYMKDGNIIKIQNALNKHGYNLINDGWFGKGTHDAVTDFQSKNGLTADGIVGTETLKKLGVIL